MAKRFVESMDMLLSQTPDHSIKGRVVVDQIYARYQHENPQFHHPDGGEAFYLRNPLFAKINDYMRRIARGTITSKGVTIRRPMIEVVEDLSREVYERAPLEFGDLKASGQPIVEEDGKAVYHRQPNVSRLSEEELRIKSRLRNLFDPHRYRR